MKLKMSQEVDLGKEPVGRLLFILATFTNRKCPLQYG